MINSKTLQDYYGEQNVSLVKEGIYKCQRLASNGNALQVIYLDLTDSWINTDAKDYLESIVATDYYNAPGYLQWNYYYYFISPDALIAQYKREKKSVECDESFARKFVLSEAGFRSLIDINNEISDQSKSQIKDDLFSIWVNKLREFKLNFVYQSTGSVYKQFVENYINGIDFPDQPDSPTSGPVTPFQKLSKINVLNLTAYRKYPQRKDYNFGQVVLICGSNATGKTSFLDAIELIVTGSTRVSNETYKLSLIDQDKIQYTYPDKNSNYKTRDSDWYKSSLNRGQNLNGNFNRFNYFTSDAAFQLKDNDGEQDLEDIISSVALGKEVNRLEERMSTFKSRFDEQNSQLSKQLKFLSDDLISKANEIKGIKDTLKDPEEFRNNLKNYIENNGWICDVSQSSDDLILKISTVIQSASDILEKITTSNVYDENASQKLLLEQLAKLNNVARRYKNLNALLFTSKRKLGNANEDLKRLTVSKKDIEELQGYLNHPDFDSLKGIGDNIKNLNASLQNLTAIKEAFDEIPMPQSYLDLYGNQPLSGLERNLLKRTDEVQTDQKQVLIEIEQMETGLSRLSKIVADIKNLGKQFLEQERDANNCPLCYTPFKPEELISAIEETQISFASSDALKKLKERRDRNISLILQNEIESVILIGLRNVLQRLVSGGQGSSWSVIEIVNRYTSITSEIQEINIKLARLNSIQSQFVIADLTEERYELLSNRLRTNYEKTINKANLDSYVNLIQTEYNNVTATIKRLEAEIQNLNGRIASCFSSQIPDENRLSQLLYSYQSLRNCFTELETFLNFNDTETFNSISQNLQRLKSIFTVYRDVFNESNDQNTTIALIERDIKKIVDDKAVVEQMQIRAAFAVDRLGSILRENSKSDYLRDYLDQNQKEIVDIFKLIHSPKEFDNITFSNSKITLYSGTEERSLEEISTGQRSALALSIFLSLNKKLDKGPDILLFDDPVAYVDDLNALSFIDYLRELVLTNSRQIFFATANQDLAFLIKKKFEFLNEEELTVLEFERDAE